MCVGDGTSCTPARDVSAMARRATIRRKSFICGIAATRPKPRATSGSSKPSKLTTRSRRVAHIPGFRPAAVLIPLIPRDGGLHVAFMQRALGVSLTGDVSDHTLFFLYGTGSNGKTLFQETVCALLGGPRTAKVPVYSHFGGATPEALVANAQKILAEGFNALNSLRIDDVYHQAKRTGPL